MRARSKKMTKIYVQRRKLVAEMLLKYPYCQKCKTALSTEVHEVLSRARGGNILDPNNCRTLCHKCHFWITTNPALATAQGWLKNSWDS